QPLRKHEDVCIFYRNHIFQPTYHPQMTDGEPYNKGHRKNQLTGSYGDFSSVEVKSEGQRYPSDVYYCKTAESEGEVFHPTQKPIELGRYLIRTYTDEGELVLDNTSGSGSFLISASLENRKFVGIELNKETILHKKEKVDLIQTTKQRLKKLKPDIEIKIYDNNK
ncbi:MAG: DNA methyltransferase, partial [Candidatus Paceibacterota bacterium]